MLPWSIDGFPFWGSLAKDLAKLATHPVNSYDFKFLGSFKLFCVCRKGLCRLFHGMF